MDVALYPYHLKPGCHLLPASDGGWLVYTAEGQWIKLNVDGDKIARLQQILAHSQCEYSAQQDIIDQRGVRTEFEAFLNYGLLTPNAPTDDPQQLRLQLRLTGDGVLAENIATMLSAEPHYQVSHEPLNCTANQTPFEPATGNTRQLLIHYSRWHDDRTWCWLDQQSQRAPFHWLAIYHEGQRLYISPLFSAQGSLSYRDMRTRRLANADHPDALLSYFQYLNSEPVQPPPPAMKPAVRALACAQVMLRLESLVHRDTASTPVSTTETAIDLQSGQVHHHPILPLPPPPAS